MGDVQKLILRHLANGASFKVACRMAGVARQTGYRMRKRDAEFGAAVNRLLHGSRAELSERERREAEADLRNERDKKIDALRSKFARTGEYATPQELAEVGLGEPPEYSEESQRAEPLLKLSSDPGFRPGMQSPDRAQRFDFECRARERDRRRRWYADPFNWHQPVPPDFK